AEMIGPGVMIRSVYPSLSARATASLPRVPPAPGRFSITTGWPSFSCSDCATMRPMMSAPPPGPNGTTMRTGRCGQSCAAASAAPRSHAAEAASRLRRVSINIPPSACGGEPPPGGPSFVTCLSLQVLYTAISPYRHLAGPPRAEHRSPCDCSEVRACVKMRPSYRQTVPRSRRRFIMHPIVEPPNSDRATARPVSRRTLLEGSASAGLVAAGAGWGAARLRRGDANAADGSPRKMAAFRMRQAAAQAYLDEPQPLHRSNGDEARYADKRASFTKTLPHNDAGEVDAEAFATFVSLLSSGDPNGFETIPRDRNAEVELNDPQATYAFDLVGFDSAATSLEPPPAFASARMATEMAELYWRALTRDVPFRDYETDTLVAAAVADMNAFTEPLTSGTGENPTPATVFRGETRGDTIGPFLSQFLWLDIPYGIKAIEQRYAVPSRGQSFLTNYAEWLACQRGAKPRSTAAFD